MLILLQVASFVYYGYIEYILSDPCSSLELIYFSLQYIKNDGVLIIRIYGLIQVFFYILFVAQTLMV